MTSDRRSMHLTVNDLSVTYPEAVRAAPAHATFDVSPGEVVLVLGPSGSGKSTLALSLNGLIPHAIDAEISGSVTCAGYDTADATPADLSRHVGMVFQDPDAQVVTATCFDEVAFALENLCLPLPEVLQRTERTLRAIGLWERRDDDPALLSGGGRQRLAIACAIATGAPLLVLDEPTANLDPAGIDDVYALLTDIAADASRGIVLVEHNLDAALRIATRIVALDTQGRVLVDGSAIATLRSHHQLLLNEGVWLPSAMLAALRLRDEGWHFDDLPVTPDELDRALAARSHSGALPPAPERPATTPAISVTGLNVRKSRTQILHDVSLEIASGSFTAVIGTNGSGKTTLVQALAGVVPPPRGTVAIDGQPVSPRRRTRLMPEVGFVFQNPEHQFVAATVAEELAVGLRGESPEAREATVADMLQRFGLTEHADRHPFRLSGGQKRRLSVATALVTRPRVLILDEPTYGQDRARADEMMRLLGDLHDEGTTIIVVTHDLDLVARHTTHTIVMNDGRLVHHARTSEIVRDADLLARAGLRPPALDAVLARHPAAAAMLDQSELRSALP